MITQIRFRNFKALQDTTLPLGRFTLLVGPNGSGKSSVIQAIEGLRSPGNFTYGDVVSVGHSGEPVEIVFQWSTGVDGWFQILWATSGDPSTRHTLNTEAVREFDALRARLQVFNLRPTALREPATIVQSPRMAHDGSGFVAVLDELMAYEDQFERLNREFCRWLPEFARIRLKAAADAGKKTLVFQTAHGCGEIPAREISDGTILALAVLTLAHLPEPPPFVAFEEPDHGLHPRLLRNVQEALYRLSYPEGFGETRPPTQVLATTHSPYFLDLFREHPEEVVIANKQGLEATFVRLVDLPNLEEILSDSALGEVWYTGILGGVPTEA